MSKRKQAPAIHNSQNQPPPAKTTIASFQGPLPPPQLLDHYNQIIPGSAERILRLFEIQVDHRQKMESAIITSDVSDSRLGLPVVYPMGNRTFGLSNPIFSLRQRQR